ncbi:hypothetical protein L5515_000170 [Caenorhabditis briggsae]|uniref:Uncharacterized protein n=1 Tax=Caenorhabditis briggsae TaxID=6238 RepID=A0AAE9DZ75_CAEBR|nr:hypothetical protein L5515_000170 [Caenorhabditis briggsae]
MLVLFMLRHSTQHKLSRRMIAAPYQKVAGLSNERLSNVPRNVSMIPRLVFDILINQCDSAECHVFCTSEFGRSEWVSR